jgi:hypothetical protein
MDIFISVSMKNRIKTLIFPILMFGMSIGINSGVTGSCSTLFINPVSGLKANCHDGQVFLTWNEAETPEGTTFNVYVAKVPVVDVAKARCVGHHIQSHSARDWWEDPASFTKDTPAGKPIGFLIESGGQRLDPKGGLFVHTVQKGEKGKLYFAITTTDEGGREDRQVAAGINSMIDGIKAAPGSLRPIWQREGRQPEQGIAKGKALWLNLHSKGGVVSDMEYLVFSDETLGWREGLPIKFSVRIHNDELEVRPTDRVWINRPHLEANDGGMNAIWTFWYGYNSMIYDRSLMSKGQPTNYTERILIWILGWVRDYYQPDTNRWYCSGSSMGGCGTISFGLHHPELFAAIHAHVPIVSYTYLGAGSAHRLEPSCWTGSIPDDLNTTEGVPLLERMNGTKFVLKTKADLPFVFLINGRSDASIPWENNPPFYQALATMHQGFSSYWDNGRHDTSGKDAPEDVKSWPARLRRFRLNESFPVFTHMSCDKNPGNGQPTDGDMIGWINRGIDWKDIEDTRDYYAITVIADYPGLQYPVKTDVTLRRVQNFKPHALKKLQVYIGESQVVSVAVKADGSIEIPGVVIPSRNGVRIKIGKDGV